MNYWGTNVHTSIDSEVTGEAQSEKILLTADIFL